MSQSQSGAAPLPPQRSHVLRNLAFAGAVIAPLAMLLPPRKFDFRFFILAGTFSLSTNQLAQEYTGRSLYARFGNRVASVFDNTLPEGAQRTRQLLKEQREREHAEKTKTAGLLKDIWMGGETDDWQEKRDAEHQKSLEEGKGLSGIIMDQIAEVWSGNYAKKNTEGKKDGEAPPEGRERK
ncbi:hypothetical protein E4U17_006126 [Claviceps sp. LM77 group G4]|nr:hypothetical protein E4U17_006126 [Claviceps sp. LM77 group G4]KAG6068635.1 hypothetical protein E4U33_005020 [Claviceps sp. LM78 group G4]KAG6071160.1 hypothetical protein E4U16_006309 [Claviceps sp. LM84 group G4]